MAEKIEKEKIDGNANYLKMGDDVYVLKKVNCKKLNIEKELKEYYKAKYDAYIERVEGRVSEGMTKDWTTQLDKIHSYSSKGIVAVPEGLMKKLLIVSNQKEVCEAKVVIYSPFQAITSMGNLLGKCPALKLIHEGFKKVKTQDTIVVDFTPPFSEQMVVAYSKKKDLLLTPFAWTLHTLSNREVCTGDIPAMKFFQLSSFDLGKEMSILNLFSPARSEVNVGGNVYHLTEFITDETITNVVRRKRGWKT